MRVQRRWGALRLVALLCSLCLCASLCGCATAMQILGRAPSEEGAGEDGGNLPSLDTDYGDYGACLSFSYGFGAFNSGYWDYSVFTQDGRTYLKGEGSNGVELNVLGEVPREVLDELDAIVAQNRIYEWNGFYAGDSDVLDGDSFRLMVEYENATLSAGGYVDKPENYELGHEALAAFFAEAAKGVAPKELGAQDEILEISLYLEEEAVGLDFHYDAEYAQYQHETVVDYDFSALDSARLWQLKYDAVDAYNNGRDRTVRSEASVPFLRIKYRMGGVEAHAELRGKPSLYGNDYDDLRAQALAVLGLPQNLAESAAYQRELFQGQFRGTQTVMLYDGEKNAYNEIIIDMPQQQLLLNGRLYSAGQAEMLAFYEQLSTLQAGSFLEQGFYHDSYLVMNEYVDPDKPSLDDTMFRNVDREKNLWLFAESSGWRLRVHGGAEYPHDWDTLLETFDTLTQSARRVYNTRSSSSSSSAPEQP